MQTRVALIFVLMIAVLALSATAPFAIAQEGTPEAAPSLLDGLGLPTLEVTVTADGPTLPTEIAAGPVVLTAVNETEAGTTVDIVQLPGGVTLDDWLSLNDAEGVLPEWTADIVLAGYVSAEPTSSTSIVINLAPGEWTVIAGDETEGTATTATLTVTGEAPADVAIAADFDLDMGAYVFNFPETMATGPQIWHVVNSHAVPHHAIIFPVDRLYTTDEVAEGFMAEFSGTPVADGFSMGSSIMGPPAEVPVMTSGQEIWMEANLAPGYYVAVCFISDPGGDIPHIMQGMIDTFEVTGE